ncbi:MAG: PriCT-2 domain-containing protein, partial [Gammaproteobacteria bacterium]|nr:PriCT-2 domain-containing protein [Gammaproteobacteria bacterium]
MPTASQEPKRPDKHLKAGEINLDLIPAHWPLTPLRDKRAYIAGWTSQPYSIERIRQELEDGAATGVGLISGQWSNEGGLIWVDIDGPDAIPELEALAGGSINTIFPPTLTVSSGKEGRQRMLFSIPSSKLSLLPDKATIKIGIPSFEILFRSRQGAIMGSHPDTEGYYTTPHGGFEHAKNPPELPQWLFEAIAKKFPTNKYRKSPSVGVVTQQVNLSYEEGSEYQKEDLLNEAKIYLDHLSPERAIDYEEWIIVGVALHQIDETLLQDWVDWSSEAPNFEVGVCEQKWETFEKMPGGPAPEGGAGLHTLRAKAKEDGFVEFGGFVVESSPEVLAKRAKALFKEGKEMKKENIADLNTALKEIIGAPSKKEKEEIEQATKGRARPKTPPASELADFVTGMVIECGWRYDPKFDTFMFYQKNKGTWRREEYRHEYKHFVQDLFLRENIPTPGGFTSHLLSDVVNLTQAYITHTYWDDDDDRLAFKNGVLEISTGEFLDHNPEYYLTWGLDFDYDSKASPGPIIDWLKRTQYGDEERVQVLRAWLKACLIGQGHELQRFLEVIGPGGRGKSTFANLCCALVGHGNYASTTLNQLEQSRFEVASIKGKRLTLINDSERYGGSAQIFKALTGGDNLRFEEKNKNVGEPFVYTGMVMVCANEPIQTTDNTSGLTRRRLTVEFNRSLWDKNSQAKEMIKVEGGVVKGLWKNFLPGLVNWVLSMKTEEMREYLLDTYEKVHSLKRVRNEILLNSNNLVEWLQSEIIHQADVVSSVGKKIPAAKDAKERYCNSNFHLYASYCSYCEDTGSKPVGQKRFIAL